MKEFFENKNIDINSKEIHELTDFRHQSQGQLINCKFSPEYNNFNLDNQIHSSFSSDVSLGLNEKNIIKDELIKNDEFQSEKLKKELNKYMKENEIIKDELNNYKKLKEKFKEKENEYKKDNKKLKEEINLLKNENSQLKNELLKVNKILTNFNNNENKKENNNFNEINYLKELLKSKEKEIDYLTLQLKNIESNNKKLVDFDNIMVINFISTDQKINCGIKCVKTDILAEVEEKLYQKYEEFRETNNNLIAKGKTLLRFKKICDNGIKDGDTIQLIKIE